MSDTTLLLTAGLDRPLAWSRGGSVRYLVAEVHADRARGEAKPAKPLNLAIVIDASGSMDGPKLASAKQAAAAVIGQLGARDILSVVSFADDIQVHLDAAPCSDGQTDRAVGLCEAIETRGTTHLSGGWLTGAECVARAMQQDAGRINRVIVLSDGLANQGITDEDELAGHAAQLRLRGIATSTVGIGDDYSATLLQTLAEHGGGQMHDAETPEEIAEVLLGELRDSHDIAVEDMALTLQTPPGTKAELVGFYPATANPGSITAVLGSIGAGRSRAAVFRLLLPEGAPGSRVPLRVQAIANPPGEEARLSSAPAELSVTLAAGAENNGQRRDLGRSLVAARAWHAVAVRTVARLNRAGDRRKARSYLERELRHFQRYAKGLSQLEPLVRELVLLLRKVDEVWNERTRKEVELGAYKQGRGETDFRSASREHWADRLGHS